LVFSDLSPYLIRNLAAHEYDSFEITQLWILKYLHMTPNFIQ